MKRIFYFAFLIFISCGTPKPAEQVTTESVPKDTVVNVARDPVPEEPETSESKTDLETISVTDNIVLAGVANYPFSKELREIKVMLDSLGIPSEFGEGENGGLSYDSAEISCNRSYGESICEADVQSQLITLRNGMKLGISLDDFLMRTGISATSNAQDVRYEYTYGANEHNYQIRFDFQNKKLVRFHYLKDPCVIYD